MADLITCIGRDGISRVFRCVEFLNENTNTFEYRVYVIDDSTVHFFELVLAEIELEVLRVIMITANERSEYKQKGIPDFLLPYVGNKLKMKVQSSPKIDLEKGHWRTPDATKVWDRLKSKGVADYDGQRDIYFLL